MLNLDPWGLFLGFVFSVIGFAYYRYGKSRDETLVLIVGIALMIYPLFVTRPVTLTVVGIFLMAGPFLARWVGW